MVAEALSEAPYGPWIFANAQRVAEIVREFGFSEPWHDDWAGAVVQDLHRPHGLIPQVGWWLG